MVRTCVVDGDVTVSIRISSQMPELWNIKMENSQNTGYWRKNYRKKSLHLPSVQFFMTPPTEKKINWLTPSQIILTGLLLKLLHSDWFSSGNCVHTWKLISGSSGSRPIPFSKMFTSVARKPDFWSLIGCGLGEGVSSFGDPTGPAFPASISSNFSVMNFLKTDC